jgi:hypothetical protein
MPEPSSDSSPALVFNVTTLGNTLAATCSTEGDAEKLTASRGAQAPGRTTARRRRVDARVQPRQN